MAQSVLVAPRSKGWEPLGIPDQDQIDKNNEREREKQSEKYKDRETDRETQINGERERKRIEKLVVKIRYY